MKIDPAIYAAIFVMTLAISIILRVKRFPKIDVKASDVLISTIVVVVLGIAVGDVKSIAFGDLKAEFQDASNVSVKKEILPVKYLIT